jgi:hypothetical protein
VLVALGGVTIGIPVMRSTLADVPFSVRS